MPKLYIISGCNGSGKTTACYTLLPDLLNCREFVNSDEFAKSLSPFNPASASVTASRYMLMKINYLLDRNADFCVETTLATRSLVKIVEEAQRRGYEVMILYFWLNSPELAIQRVRDRVASGGHHIPDPVIRRRYVMGLQYFFNTYIPVSDRWVLADNSRTPFTVVAEGSKQLMYIKDNEKYRTIWNIAHPNEEY
ncbi:MAG: zeta toxin family protein [Bacteroidales bacterium]|nr:zeta toxin family protein [Bacteroidales bacterium]